MRNILIFFISSLLLASCLDYKDVKFNGISGFEIEDFSNKKLTFSFLADIYNPNDYKIKVKSKDLDILINDRKIGTAQLMKKVKLKKQTSDDYRFLVQSDLKNSAGGGVQSLMSILQKGSINLRVRGIIKAKVRGFGKKIEIDESRNLNPSQFDLELPF